jgi:hypothetical protein
LGVAAREKNAMKTPWKSVVILSVSFLAGGCAYSMVELHESEGTYTVENGLTKSQVKEAVLEGAEAAGWRVKDVDDDKIYLTYAVRSHSVTEEIFYTETYYRYTYESSSNMKMFCTEQDKLGNKNLKISGQQECPYGRDPRFVHPNYKKWVDSLNTAIQNSLASM